MAVRTTAIATTRDALRAPAIAHRRYQAPAAKVPAARANAAAPLPPTRTPRLMPLPDVRQGTTYTCGTASLMSILAYFGWKGGDPNERAMAQELGTTWRNGTEPTDLIRMGRKLGLRVDQREHLTLDDLTREVRAGHPVMVAYQAYATEGGPVPHKKPWSEDWGDGHWSIVIGIDDQNVYLEDPSMLGKRGFIPRAEFLERWHDTDSQNQPVYQQLGLVFSSDTPKKNLNTVEVKNLAYVP